VKHDPIASWSRNRLVVTYWLHRRRLEWRTNQVVRLIAAIESGAEHLHPRLSFVDQKRIDAMNMVLAIEGELTRRRYIAQANQE
jgi:hypothetical protein